MLERSRLDEYASASPVEGRRALRVPDGAVWYVGMPFAPRRATPDGALDRLPTPVAA